jgi:hypothetical protein
VPRKQVICFDQGIKFNLALSSVAAVQSAVLAFSSVNLLWCVAEAPQQIGMAGDVGGAKSAVE